MPSKLFAALVCLTITSSAACSSTGAGGSTPEQSRQQVASQSSAPPVASTPAAAPAPAAAAPEGNPNAEACKLLTSEEIQSVQGEGVKAAKGSDASTGEFAISQCFYETTGFTNSVSLTLTSGKTGAKGEGPRDFFRKNFAGGKGRDEDARGKEERAKVGGGRGEEEEGTPPARVGGVGDDAYWVGNSKVGTLYVLKGNKFIRVSVGGADSQEKKIEKSKALAQRALKRV